MNLAKIVDFERKFVRSKIWKSTEFSLNMMVISLMNCHYLRFNKTISLDLEIWIRGIEMSDSWPNEFLEIYSGNNVKFWEFDQLIDQLYFDTLLVSDTFPDTFLGLFSSVRKTLILIFGFDFLQNLKLFEQIYSLNREEPHRKRTDKSFSKCETIKRDLLSDTSGATKTRIQNLIIWIWT